MSLRRLFAPLASYVPRLSGPVRLDWLQVGVSSRNMTELSGYSLRAVYKDQWENRDLALKTFMQIRDDLPHVALVHLQGWGEPLSHPDFFSMAAVALKAGCRVSTSIFEPSVLDDKAIESLVGMGVHTLTVNISSLDATRNRERAGFSLDALCRALERIERIKTVMGSRSPRVMGLYSLFRSSMHELDRLPAFLGRFGVETLLLNPLSFVPDANLAAETVVPDSEEQYVQLMERFESVKAQAEKRGMDVHYFLLHAERGDGCLESPHRALYLGPDGDVSPCIFSQFPVAGRATYQFKGMQLPMQRITFGNVLEQPLRHIWSNPKYREFRSQCKSTEGAPECGNCWRPHIRAF